MEHEARSLTAQGGGDGRNAVLDTGSDGNSAPTIRDRLEQLTRQYTYDIRGNTSIVSQHVLRQLIASLEMFWHQASNAGVFSANEDVDEFSTTALEALWIPYLIADAYQRIQDPSTLGDARTRDGRDTAASFSSETRATTNALDVSTVSSISSPEQPGLRTMQEDRLLREARLGREFATRTNPPLASPFILTPQTRQEALAQSHRWFDLFLEWMQRIGLVDEKTVELYREYHSDRRSTRVELSRRCAELLTSLQTLEHKLSYARAKKQRLRAIIAESANNDSDSSNNNNSVEDDTLDGNADIEEEQREYALARLRWSCFDAFHQLQLSSRELTMLESIQPEQRAAIVAEYQQRIHAPHSSSSSRQTYTILPNGMMTLGTLRHPQPVPVAQVTQTGEVYTSPAAVRTLTASGNPSLFREHVQSELMLQRNAPTMTLQEFAEKEMAEMQRRVESEARARDDQAAEDERLGKDGVEERQRQKDSKWADWKDDHPAFGPSSKGNF